MHVFVLYCNTMHDHGTESRGLVLFCVTRGNTSGTCIETRFNLFQSVSSRTNTHYWYIVPLVIVCSSQHELKQIKLCFNSHAVCEAALRSDGRLSFSHISCSTLCPSVSALYSQYSIYLIHEFYSFLDQIRYLLKQYFVFLLGTCMRFSGLWFCVCIFSQGTWSIFYVCLLY